MAKKHRKENVKAVPAAVPQEGRFPSWLVWPLAAAWAAAVLKSYFARFKPDLSALAVILSPGQYAGLFSALPGHLLDLAAAALFMFACFAAGRAALKAAGFSFLNAVEEAVFCCGAGLGLLAAFVFVLSTAGLLYAWPVLAFLAAACAWGAWDLKRRPAAPLPRLPSPRAGDLAALGVLLLALLVNLAGALSPEIFYDSLVYHLAVPNFYVIKHGFARMPFNFYSDMPFTHGMIYASALLVKGPVLAKLVNFLAGALIAGAVLAVSLRWFSLRTGLLAAAVFCSVPHAMMASWSAGTEMLLTLFSVLGLYAVLLRRDEEPRWLWLAACFCGLAMGVKYTGVFAVAGVMAAYAWSGRARPAAALRNLAVFVLVSSLFVLPWLAKNWLYTGNPVFPFALNLFGAGHGTDPQKLRDFAAHAAQMGPLTPLSWLVTPWKATMGQIANSEYFSPLFLLLLPLSFLLAAGPAAGVLAGLWAYFLAAWLGWSVTSTMVRFLMPAYPAAALLIAASLFSPGHAGLKRLLRGLALAVCLLCVYWGALLFYMQGRWRPVTGAVGADDYLSHTQPTYPYSGYAALKFVNENTPPGSKALMIGDERSFYLKRDFIVSSVYDRTAIVEYAAASKDGEDLYARLRADGVTHLTLNLAEGIRLGRDYRMFYWDDRARAVFNDFWDRHVKEVFASAETQDGRPFNRVSVYELQDKPAGPPPFNVVKEIIMKNVDAARR